MANMYRIFSFFSGFVLFTLLVIPAIRAQTLKEIEATGISLPNGWSLSPVGKMIPLGDLPLNIAVSPDKKLLAVTNNGQSIQTIQLIDAEKMITLDTVIIAKSWLGITFSENGKYLYASGGNDNRIIRYQIKNKKIAPFDTLVIGKPWPEKISIAGIAVDDDRELLYTVTKEDNSLYVFDIKNKVIVKKLPLGGEGYTCLLSAKKDVLYISCWGCDKVLIFDTKKQEFSGWIPVGDNPNDMCLTKDNKFLFVANANDNTVSVISLKEKRVIEILNSALYPDSPQGSTTNSVALDKDDKTLFIANADNNCLAVFDVSNPGKSFSKGFIPTGWYPTCVRVVNKVVFVANGKGITSKPNPLGPSPMSAKERTERHQDIGKNPNVEYIGGLFRGTLQAVEMPSDKQLGIYSQAVYKNVRYVKDKEMSSTGEEGNPVPMKVGEKSPIKYVFYVIKENRTYDQVLGDLPGGNGDTNLVLFGKNVTPNLHALAEQFVLLDNFYVDGEVSADGHNWTMGAYATDYLEKNWPTSYGSRGGGYPGEAEREIANGKVFLWDLCKRYGVSYRSYGEFISDPYKANIPSLEGHFLPGYTGFELSIRDTSRFYQWKHDFDSLLLKGEVPGFNTIRFANDHTEGLKLGRPTPKAHAADNDLACGMFVEYLSHSPIWNECLIIMVEDDAQNGPDHVDAHRSTTYLAGGFVKKGFVDHTLYSTSSALRTIELILGLPPMSQYDASAEPMWRCFEKNANHPPFNALPNKVDLNLKNKQETAMSKLSETFNFKVEDRIPDDQFNKVIWAAVKGYDSSCPAPVHAAFFNAVAEEDDED